MNTLSLFDNFPLGKAEQANFVTSAVETILSGYQDPLEVDMRLKALEEVIKAIRTDERVKQSVIDTAELYGKKSTLHGVDITVSSRTVRDYSGCNDPVWSAMTAELEALKKAIKAREATLDTGTDPATGEVFNPPATSTTVFLTYKFK